MKQHLLLGTALLAAIGAFSQNRLLPSHSAGAVPIKKSMVSRAVQVNEKPVSPLLGSGVILPTKSPQAKQNSSQPTTISWDLVYGSNNVYGQVTGRSRGLQYNHHLNAVSIVHRNSATYSVVPNLPSAAQTGIIVAEISTNWGLTWDSTAIWADQSHWGRYPQGGIYNPPGNTNINNAYIVGSGVTVGTNSFDGNWYASKKLGTYSNTLSTTPGAQQYFSFLLPSYPAHQPPHAWSMTGFTSTDDGIVRSLANILDDPTASTTMRGYAVVTGTFNGSAFDWRVDTLIPDTYLDPAGEKHLYSEGQMAFNQAGTVGYVVGLGAINTGTLANKGYQPIIYKMDKTTNANATWTLMPGIDFNSMAMRPAVKSTFEGLTGLTPMHVMSNGDTIGVPYFTDFDITVDATNKLHIGSLFFSTAREHSDSLNYVSEFTTSINPTEEYRWRHTNGHRPYFWDFIGDGSNFSAVLIDSIASEAPAVVTGYGGYNENPWDPSGANGQKAPMDSRIQLGRTPDGQFITFSWAESDSGFTNNAFKWNTLPDIKVRLMAVGTGTNMYRVDDLSFTNSSMQNITENDNDVKSRASLHYMSPTTGSATIHPGALGAYTVDINTPFTVTNSSPYSQATNNTTWYGAGKLSYVFPRTEPLPDGVFEQSASLLSARLYPNPTHNSVSVYFASKENSSVEINVLNSVGQVVQTKTATAFVGENNLKVDLNGLASGIYFVSIKTENSATTKKLVIE